MFTFGMLDGVLFHLGPIPVDHIVVTQWAIIAIIGIVAFMATRNMQMVPRGLQNAFEALIVWTYDFFTQLMDKEHIAKKYAPLLSTFFIFIIVSNYSGLIPGAGQIPGYQPPTANWNTTLTLALITAITVQIAGFAEHGVHYLGHFISPSPLMLPLNLGEEMILAFMLYLVPFLVPGLLMGLSVLLAAIQAVVFTILSASYIATATGEGH